LRALHFETFREVREEFRLTHSAGVRHRRPPDSSARVKAANAGARFGIRGLQKEKNAVS
jgi:hypothetical protein